MPWEKTSFPVDEPYLQPVQNLQATIVPVHVEEPSLSLSEKLARARSSAVHPTAFGSVSKARWVRIGRAHDPLSNLPPAGATWPRAVIRPMAGLADGTAVYVAKIWFDSCCPVKVNGIPVSKTTTSRQEAWNWAEKTVGEFRQMCEFGQSNSLGTAERRWAPQW